ncbi:MAG: right-handed parallel beta-helix repeat-containing protein [Myxococcota bacterium]
MNIRGDACASVILRGATAAPGAWRGLLIDNDATPNPENTIEFAEIRHAGGGAFNSNGDLGALILWADNRLTLTDSLISESADVGLNLNYRDSELTFARNRFEGNGNHPVFGAPEYMAVMDSETTFTNNTVGDHAAFFEGTLPAGAVLSAMTVPYRVLVNSVVSATEGLTISAGVEMLFEANTGLSVTGSGALTINGTALGRRHHRGQLGCGLKRHLHRRLPDPRRGEYDHRQRQVAGPPRAEPRIRAPERGPVFGQHGGLRGPRDRVRDRFPPLASPRCPLSRQRPVR